MKSLRTALTTILLAAAATLHAATFTKAPKVTYFRGDFPAVRIAATNLCNDWQLVTGTPARLSVQTATPLKPGTILVGTLGCGIEGYLTPEEIDTLEGRREMYLMKVCDERAVIAGSDRRGTVYGIYALSEKIGVSPWYWWADAPVRQLDTITIPDGT